MRELGSALNLNSVFSQPICKTVSDELLLVSCSAELSYLSKHLPKHFVDVHQDIDSAEDNQRPAHFVFCVGI